VTETVLDDASPAGAAPSAIVFEKVTKTYADGTTAVAMLDLEVREHELLCLVGPSGCGKSTILRMVNRLVEPTSGRILLEGQDITSGSPVALRRGIGYVIQHVGLLPHRTVAQNVATVPGLLGWPRDRTRARVAELLEVVGLPLETYGKRYPSQLSGGERQRVGVARALAVDPPVLLMDEPFGAVDPLGRRALQQEFRRIHARIGTTVMFVTHDIDEAVLMADRIAVFSKGGRVEQVGSPAEVLAAPATPFVRSFVGDGRAVRLMSVVRLAAEDLEPYQPGSDDDLVLGATLDEVFAKVALSSTGRVGVLDRDGAPAGLVTPQVLHAVLRRSFTEPEDTVKSGDGAAQG
jgi:osmoprotectant transport system ATP-binding protein